jgi:superfamily II RNA helicase
MLVIFSRILYIALLCSLIHSFVTKQCNRPYEFCIKSISGDIKNDNTFTTIIEKYREELASLRGTPELVDRLENIARHNTGIEKEIELYRLLYPFKLDKFQEDGLHALINGNNALITTPTGSGKTLVGELAIYYALMLGLRVAYTTPLKALSNQKFQDFTAKYGGDRVGLLTGDVAINRGAAITVMTTEVFRNMVYDPTDDQLGDLFMVCFDEFHFMNDPDRGTVWEESVISCPKSIRILALSATMGNVNDIKGWISSIHRPTTLVMSDFRPVPLRYLFAMKQGLLPLFRDPNAGPGSLQGLQKIDGKLGPGLVINPTIIKHEEQAIKMAQQRMVKNGKPFKIAKINPQGLIAKYSDIVEELNQLKLLPAIVFIFSRAGCEQSAKLIMQTKVKLLNEDEVSFVTQAINNFVKMNPEIPFSKSDVQMLRAGVGVHHAGLIPVLKAFIEDLFNANKIKVLFATETLAAGVNMPAKTTVISTVTKRINSEVIKLKTSQLLQMAGRAGRRGKDTEGTVIIMRNRFEDAKVGHKILVSPIDGIKSHFKTSYGLTVKLLETKNIDECRALIERGFGAYLLQQKLVKQEKNDIKEEIELYRSVLQKYSLKTARDYLKTARRLEKERRNDEFLMEKMVETDNDLVMAIADYMPLGIGIKLQNEESGYFLGDVKWGVGNVNSGLGVFTKSKRMLIVSKEHIRSFVDSEHSLPTKTAQILLDLVNIVPKWIEESIPGIKKKMLVGQFDLPLESKTDDIKLYDALNEVYNSKTFPETKIPGSIIRQQMIVKELETELNNSPISASNDGELVIKALRYAAGLKDPIGFVNEIDSNSGENREIYAWKMFKNVMKILQQFNALDGTNATSFGNTVSSLSGDNELWLALVLKNEKLEILSPGELGAVLCSIVVDGFKTSNAYFKHRPSENVQTIHTEIEVISWELKLAQSEGNIDFPIHLSREAGGLVESWANGTSWRDLCRETSLEQGDVCRMLRRTVEILRQVPLAYGVSEKLSNLAYEAANKMDRFPVADFMDSDSASTPNTNKSGQGFGSMGDSNAKGVDDDKNNQSEFDFVQSILFDNDNENYSDDYNNNESDKKLLDNVDDLFDFVQEEDEVIDEII